MDQERFDYLLAGFATSKISDADMAELMGAVQSGRFDSRLRDGMLSALKTGGRDEAWTNERESAVLTDILGISAGRVRSFNIRWFMYAALVLLVAGTATYLYFSPASSPASFSRNPEVSHNQPTITPGSNKAILTLADGTRKELGTKDNGLQLQTGSVELTTPRGGQYMAILPDGSHVWLNAASSIRFPAKFDKAERKVEITGEAYFEIEPDANSPFKVIVNEIEVDVLGTSFDIMAYEDESSVRTTLLSGSVNVKAGTLTKTLKPGQQAGCGKNGTINITDDTDTEETLAWKNGMLQMSGETIPSIMRQVSRWYNIEVKYPDGMPEGTLSGKIPRSMQFANVLEILQKSGVNFKQEGTTLLVYP